MHPQVNTLTRLDELEQVLAQSDEQPVLLFKHSYSCGVSAEALDELIAHLNERVHDLPVAMVTVQTHRDISNAVAARLGIRHETPQALLIRDRRVVWSASHFRVTSQSVRKAIESHLGTA
jgi:bacillithiol system protein YtxJ